MLIRFIAKNIYSFKEETEFNLLPNKTQRLAHHKIHFNDIDFLRFSAIYGANGSGKSNLIKAIAFLEDLVEEGKLKTKDENTKFKLDDKFKNEPISLAIEFYHLGKIFYYTITFSEQVILNEYLAESNRDKDILIFDRNFDGNKQTVEFFPDYYKNEKNKLFSDILAEKLILKDELLITFLSEKYEDDFPDVKTAFEWFEDVLVIIRPDAKPSAIAHMLDRDSAVKTFGNELICSLNTGIASLNVKKQKFEEFAGNDDVKNVKKIIQTLRSKPNSISVLTNSETGEQLSVVYEDDEIFMKRLVSSHLDNNGKPVEFSITMESDGTNRLIDYIPAFKGIINDSKVYLIDEIERSIHPITIKEILTKISLDEAAKGQLIFTTHESNLLDQEILRPDEIWFAQKDVDGSSKLYSLSNFKIHNTADVQNGYLNGRYGGIPFLSKLHDLNWNKYEVSE